MGQGEPAGERTGWLPPILSWLSLASAGVFFLTLIVLAFGAIGKPEPDARHSHPFNSHGHPRYATEFGAVVLERAPPVLFLTGFLTFVGAGCSKLAELRRPREQPRA